MAKTGRPTKPYHPSWGGDPIAGLTRQKDGRWRIISTGERFSEPDERRAIKRFRDWQRANEQTDTTIEVKAPAQAANGQGPLLRSLLGFATDLAEGRRPKAIEWQTAESGQRQITLSQRVDSPLLWAWLREQLIEQPEYIASMTGIPEVARLRLLPVPPKPIQLAELITLYKSKNPSTEKAKTRALRVFEQLMRRTAAKTLEDLTQEKLSDWRDEIENSPTIKSGGTKTWMYGAVKGVIGFGLKVKLDAKQISAALDRCQILWTATPLPNVNPTPIEREHFHQLLDAAGKTPWRAWLLMGLNAALYLEELCDLRWSHLDLKQGTYATIRRKTQEASIPRAAVLWPETIAAIKALPRKGPEFVFTSFHGDRYNRNTRGNDFAELRKRAKVPKEVTFASIRDGAYTAACRTRNVADGRLAKVLAGHSCGMEDKYVLRDPEIVRPVCEGVYKAYGPF